MRKIIRSALAFSLAVALPLSGSVTGFAAGSYDDFDYITGHVELAVPQKLAIASPAQNTATGADGYYLTGTSSPDEPLYLNGDEVPNRGIYGSWGVYVPLYAGENVFTVKQGGNSHSVTITRGGAGEVTTTDTITKLYPEYDSAYKSGDTINFSCIAPAGATVWVNFGDIKVELTQVAAASDGVPARFKGSLTVGGVASAHNMGKLSYSMNNKGDTKTLTSVGDVYLYPLGSDVTIRVQDTATTTFKDNAAKAVSTVVKSGAYDYVTEQTDDMYLLGMGSWVPKSSVIPVTGVHTDNVVSKIAFSKTAYGERITLTGTTNPITTSYQTDTVLSVQLHHTTGLQEFALGDSKLFSGVEVRTEGDSTILELSIKAGQSLWGHSVAYKDNITTIYCKYPPVKTGGANKPLTDIIIGLDAGHGGSDPGAFGTARLTGPVEKDITYATALAVKKRLESLGATVIMTTYRENAKSSNTDRMQAAMDNKADFYMSLHCNSVAGDGTKPNGTEIYYYYNRSKPLADVLQKNIVAATGRTNRGVKSSTFRVTLNSLTPAVLVEMGFVSNPREFDLMCTKQEIFKTANAIGDSIVELIS